MSQRIQLSILTTSFSFAVLLYYLKNVGFAPEGGLSWNYRNFRYPTINKPHQVKNDEPGVLLLFPVVEY